MLAEYTIVTSSLNSYDADVMPCLADNVPAAACRGTTPAVEDTSGVLHGQARPDQIHHTQLKSPGLQSSVPSLTTPSAQLPSQLDAALRRGTAGEDLPAELASAVNRRISFGGIISASSFGVHATEHAQAGPLETPATASGFVSAEQQQQRGSSPLLSISGNKHKADLPPQGDPEKSIADMNTPEDGHEPERAVKRARYGLRRFDRAFSPAETTTAVEPRALQANQPIKSKHPIAPIYAKAGLQHNNEGSLQAGRLFEQQQTIVLQTQVEQLQFELKVRGISPSCSDETL